MIPTNQIVAKSAGLGVGGGISTFFDAAQEDEQEALVAAGVSFVPIVFAGIVLPPLTAANQMFTMHLRMQNVITGAIAYDVGEWHILMAWGAGLAAHPLAGPGSLDSVALIADEASLGFGVGNLQSIETNGAGNVIVQWSQDALQQQYVKIKMVVSPLTVIPFAPPTP